MKPLGSPQGANDTLAHLLGVPHRVQHAAATAEEVPSPSPPPLPRLLLQTGEQTMGGQLLLLCLLLLGEPGGTLRGPEEASRRCLHRGGAERRCDEEPQHERQRRETGRERGRESVWSFDTAELRTQSECECV